MCAWEESGDCVCPDIGEEPNRDSGKSPDVLLHLGLEGGQITGGIAITPGCQSPWQAIDTSGLTLQAGTVTGNVKVEIQGLGRLIDGKPTKECAFTLDVGVAKDGTSTSGTYNGTAGETKSAGKAIAQALPARDLRGDLGVWVTLNYDVPDEKGRSWCGRWSLTRKKGEVIGGPGVTTDGQVGGQVEKGKLQSKGNSFEV